MEVGDLVTVDDVFMYASDFDREGLSCVHNKITAGRRVWPEGEDK